MAWTGDETDCIIVFLRSPDRERVKTRLSRVIGSDAAIGLYRCFVADLLEMLAKTGYPVRLSYTPADAAGDIESWLGDGYAMFPQEGSDLGMRMANAFRRVFAEDAGRALLVGTDLPDLPPERIRSGFFSLRSSPAVLTPTPDGGYCLIGFRADTFTEAVFTGQPWGTPRVLEQTLAAFQRLGRSPRLLESWPDIDTVEDLAAFVKRAARPPAATTRTAAFLAARFPAGLTAREPEAG
jgi:rSAM/selenodomain-associated transferase 1